MAADPYITTYSQTYSQFGLQQSKMWPPDTLCMTIAGANTAKTAILKIWACFPDSVVGFIPDKTKADLYFVKYSLDLMRHRFLSVSRGATQDNLSLDKLLSFPILAPDADEQRRVGAILSAYDDLIENCSDASRFWNRWPAPSTASGSSTSASPATNRSSLLHPHLARSPRGGR